MKTWDLGWRPGQQPGHWEGWHLLRECRRRRGSRPRPRNTDISGQGKRRKEAASEAGAAVVRAKGKPRSQQIHRRQGRVCWENKEGPQRKVLLRWGQEMAGGDASEGRSCLDLGTGRWKESITNLSFLAWPLGWAVPPTASCEPAAVSHPSGSKEEGASVANSSKRNWREEGKIESEGTLQSD